MRHFLSSACVFLFLLGACTSGGPIQPNLCTSNLDCGPSQICAPDTKQCQTPILDMSVTTAVSSYLTSAKISGSTTTVSPSPPSSAGYGQPVTVTVSVPFNSISWLPSPIFLGGKPLSAVSVMRRETVQ